MRQSDLFDDLPKWFVCYAKLRARVVRKIRRVIRRMIIEEQPTIGVPQIIGNAVNLCETCKYDFPECPKDSNVIFGDGKGNDNVCACSAYEVYVPPISKREWYQKGYEAGQKSVQPQKGQAEPLELQDEQVVTHIIKTCPTCHTPWRIPPTSEYLKIAKYPCCPCGQRIRWGGQDEAN